MATKAHQNRRSTSRWRKALSMVATVALGATMAVAAAPAASAAGTPVYVPDAHLKAAINQAINAQLGMSNPDGAEIILEIANQLTSLQIDGGRSPYVQDITGLQALTGLTRLDLNFNLISDLSPIENLTGLKRLSLSYNAFDGVDKLKKLVNLEYLNLRGNHLTDISPLSGMTKLKWAWLDYNEIEDISPLRNMSDLRELYLTENRISNVKPLANKAKLTRLGLSVNQIHDISPLAQLGAMDQIDVYGQTIELPEVTTGTTTISPIIGLDGKTVKVSSSDSGFRFKDGGALWTFSSTGAKTLTWMTDIRLSDPWGEFSGEIKQTVRKPTPPPTQTWCPPNPFPDVTAANLHCQNIGWLKGTTITIPSDGKYHPSAGVTRAQMSLFLYRLVNTGTPAPTCTKKPFQDVEIDNTFCGAIQWAADNHITFGVGDGTNFAPDRTVTRGQMSAFLKRVGTTAATPPCHTAPFTDVPASNLFCGTITWMSDHGITSGVGDGSAYGPDRTVNRDQMASFLHRIYDYRQAHPSTTPIFH